MSLLNESEVDIKELEDGQEVNLNEEDVLYSEDIKVHDSDNPFVLGVLKGTFMEAEVDNGNGRLYETKTLKTRVVDNPYTKKMIEHKSLLGEAHHPLERTNIWMDESAISTTLLEMRSDGTVYGEADILDTPKGRIVNTLARYGTDIGISSRAHGKGVKRGGHLVITPERYFFKTFDAVLNPGFEKARPKKYEPDGSPMKVNEDIQEENYLYEEIKSQIEQDKCDLKMLEYYIDYSGNSNLEDLKKYFEEDTDGDRSEETSMEYKELQEENQNLSKEISRLKARLQNYESDNLNLSEEKNLLKERIKYLSEETSKHSDNSATQVEELLDILYEERNSNYGISKELEELKFQFAGISSQLLNSKTQVKTMTKEIEKLDSEKASLLEEKDKLSSELASVLEEKDSKESIDEESTEESIDIEEPGSEEHEERHTSSVELFSNSTDAINEEKEQKSINKYEDRQINLIKSVGGK